MKSEEREKVPRDDRRSERTRCCTRGRGGGGLPVDNMMLMRIRESGSEYAKHHHRLEEVKD